MKIETDFILICENVIIERDSNTVSFIKVFNEIHAKKLPTSKSDIFVVASLKISEPEEGENVLSCGLSIKTPSGKELLKDKPAIQREVDTEKDIQFMGHAFGIRSLVFEEEGEYQAELRVNKKLQAVHSFIVEQTD